MSGTTRFSPGATGACLTAALLLGLPAAAAAQPERFAMSIYHFNLQYVAGGLLGFPDGNGTDPALELDEKQLEDAIVVESFEPLLDIYLRHPTWGADIELQALMLDVMRERHPGVLDKLRTLAERGQIAVDSVHWSDQLWVAFPRRDMEVSYDLTVASFAAARIPHGRSAWTQEGQWGPGLARFLAERGYVAAVLPKGLMGWLHEGAPAVPLYRMDEAGRVLGVSTASVATERVQTKWHFVDDGELAVTARKDPYFGALFKRDAQAMAELEAQLAADEAAGWKLTTVQQYALRARELGEVPQPLPPMTDGTWHPSRSMNMHKWMGGGGMFNGIGAEDDNAVLAGNAAARKLVVVAEQAAAGRPELQRHVADAWRELLLAEVSDATGWNPWIGERRYALDHAAAARAAAMRVLDDAGIAPRLRPARPDPVLVADPGPLQPELEAHASRAPRVEWKRRAGASVWEGEIRFGATEGERTVEVRFPRGHDRAVFSDALEDALVRDVPLAAFTQAELSLPLANGLVGLGEDLFLVLRTDSWHLDALLPRERRIVRFQDETAPVGPFSWRFVVVRGTAQQALAEALALNVAPDRVLAPEEGCGCGSAPALLPGIAALALILRRRRPRR